MAIAISLVPPLAVVGLTLESGAPDQSVGALLLFATNVTAIIATGTAVLVGYRIRAAAVDTGRLIGRLRARTIVIVTLLVVVAVPLGIGSYQVFRTQAIVTTAQPVAERWAEARFANVVDVTVRQGVLQVAVVGPPGNADASSLRRVLDDAGLADVPARLSLVVGGSQELPVPAAG